MDHLKEISSWISSANDLDRLLHLVVETAVRAMDARAGSLLLLDRKTSRLHFQVATGEKREQIKAYEVDLGQGIAGTVAKTGTSLLIPDVEKDARWCKEISLAIGYKTHSIVCVPMRMGTTVIGVVQIIDKLDGTNLTENNMDLLQIYADLAAVAIGNAQRIARMNQENKELRTALGINSRIIGESKQIKQVIANALKVAESKTSVLITGESGTGKELLARLIHDASPRSDKPLVVLNCAAVPEGLLEDELFGHEKGAFTGAVSRKTGRFESADGGTIFLDEIGEMIPGMQAKLLRVVQEGIFYRVGGVSPIHVDVRVLSATNRNIEKEVAEGRFREDLYYRLNVVHLEMPPLRDRKEDIPLLCHHFLNLFRSQRGISRLRISRDALERMTSYDWPGNVRELSNALERSVVMGNGVQIMPEDLPIEGPRSIYHSGLQSGLSLQEAVSRFKKAFIEMTLAQTGGNRSRAAGIMGIQRTYLSRLVSKYNL
ncbi:MAG: sigma 54-interacting transcriptional regulator [Desulfobacterales bacterium]|jgi:Nif-specific regulatory protein|nr:sigma 54-interacting transcriptional regulator [Desulfobacterales bacterium]